MYVAGRMKIGDERGHDVIRNEDVYGKRSLRKGVVVDERGHDIYGSERVVDERSIR